MKIELNREEMLIIPETEPEKVYLEEVFNLKSEGSSVEAIRKNKAGVCGDIGGFLHISIKKATE